MTREDEKAALTKDGILDRAIRLVRAVAEAGTTDVRAAAASAGVPTSTAYRIVASLQEGGLLRRSDDGRLEIGWVVYYLANVAACTDRLPGKAQPFLEELSREVGETAFLGVRSDSQFVIVAKAEASQELRTTFPLGTHLPLERGALGKVLLEAPSAGHPGRPGWPGYSTSDEDAAPGVRAIAAPVYDHAGTVVCGISVAGPVHRFRIGPQTILPVLETARRVSTALGYQAHETTAPQVAASRR